MTSSTSTDTKAMTATLIAVLVADGALSWTTTVEDVFGERYGRMDPGWKGTTLEQLLHSRAGAPADLHAEGLGRRLWQQTGSPREQPHHDARDFADFGRGMRQAPSAQRRLRDGLARHGAELGEGAEAGGPGPSFLTRAGSNTMW